MKDKNLSLPGSRPDGTPLVFDREVRGSGWGVRMGKCVVSFLGSWVFSPRVREASS